MIDFLEIEPNNNILEIRTGNGYNSSIMSLLCKNVVTMEVYEDMCIEAKKINKFLIKNNILQKNIIFIYGNGFNGYRKRAPYDRIIATCGSNDNYPKKLKNN